MPNIIITEGLDTPWELKDTESNITAETELENLNLVNQIVGQLAYTSSQLLTGLKTETVNLNNIVKAIDLITEEIALFPDRVAKWDNLPSIEMPDSTVALLNSDYGYVIATDSNSSLTELAQTTPLNFYGPLVANLGLEKAYVSGLLDMIEAKPSLDAAGVKYQLPLRYLVYGPPVGVDPNANTRVWSTVASVVNGVAPTTVGEPGDLVVYRNSTGQISSYESVFEVVDPVSGEKEVKRIEIDPRNVYAFPVPKDPAELAYWREELKNHHLITSTNALASTIGLPSGVTPSVTTLGLSVDKYFDKARYSTIEVTRQDNGIINASPGQTPKIIFGDYPPLSPANLDLSKMTQADVNKFFQEPGTNRIFYIESITDGRAAYRLVTKQEPFITKMTDDVKKALRGEYAEKQILLTQRSTDQTIFVSSISQRYTSFSDLATNALKTLMNFYNEIARNLRG